MKKAMMTVALLALVMVMAVPAWADGPGIKVVTGWWAANTTGLGVVYSLGASRGMVVVAGSIPESDTQKPDSIAAIEDAYKVNPQGVENALGTFNDDLPVAYSAGLINYMARVGFNPASVGGPNIPPGSVTQSMMPNGYLMVDTPGPDGYVNNAGGKQLNPGETPDALAGAVTTPAPQPVNQNSQSPGYVKPQPSEVQTKPTQQEVATTSPSVPPPGQGTLAPQKLTLTQQQAAAQHMPENYITKTVRIPKANTGFAWKWVYIGGGGLILIAVVTTVLVRRRKQHPAW